MSYFQNLKLKEYINGANFITLTSLWLTLYVIILRFYGQANAITAILTLITITADFFDGYFARKFKCETEVGAALDRFRDKLLSGFYFWFTFVSYQKSGNILSSLLIVTLASLFLIELALFLAGIWGLAKGKSVKSTDWGKHKMVAECIGIILWVIFNDIAPFGLRHTDLIPASFVLFCFITSFFLAGKSLQEYWNRYFEPPTNQAV
jgi:phosphatidylglycerophosphate synthase